MFHNDVFGGVNGVLILVIMLLIVWFAPNTADLLKNYGPAINAKTLIDRTKKRQIVWKPSVLYVLIISGLLVASIFLIPKGGEFLYFDF
jgi:hypothetical protein